MVVTIRYPHDTIRIAILKSRFRMRCRDTIVVNDNGVDIHHDLVPIRSHCRVGFDTGTGGCCTGMLPSNSQLICTGDLFTVMSI